ncbi:MAG: threonine/serine exporter family protein [Gemmataceae bacterium]
MTARRLHTELLAHAGRLLLEYDESTGAIHRALESTASALTGDPCQVTVSYGSVAVSVAGEMATLLLAPEIRYNTAIQARVHAILRWVRLGALDPAAALAQLDRVEIETPRHARWVAVAVLGVAAASLARLLGADAGAVAVAGVASGLGLLIRQELGRRHFNLLTLPLSAALIGALLGGVALRLDWTTTPELVLIVPALMLIPGPHLINGILDLVENYIPMSMARLTLAIGILLASALGVILGVELVLPGPLPETDSSVVPLNLVSDMALAGIVTCGFAVFYNTPWAAVAMAAVGGMAGHGLRFLGLEAGASLEAATFLGGFAVGAVSGWMARSGRTPIAVVAFAGAVTMIPGLNLYRALAGALRLARSPQLADPGVAVGALSNGLQACLVISALALGLIAGAKTVAALTGAPDSARKPPIAPKPEQKASLAGREVR